MKALEQAIYTALAGRAGLTALLATATSIYPDIAPEDAALPAVTFQAQPNGSDAYVYGARAYETLEYTIKGITAGQDPEAANDIAIQIDLALSGTRIAISGRTNMLGLRMGRVSYPEQGDAGDYYQHRGGIYRWMVQ